MNYGAVKAVFLYFNKGHFGLGFSGVLMAMVVFNTQCSSLIASISNSVTQCRLVIMLLRLYALWGKSRVMLAFLATLFVAEIVLVSVAAAQMAYSMQGTPPISPIT